MKEEAGKVIAVFRVSAITYQLDNDKASTEEIEHGHMIIQRFAIPKLRRYLILKDKLWCHGKVACLRLDDQGSSIRYKTCLLARIR